MLCGDGGPTKARGAANLPSCWDQDQLLTEDTSHETVGWASAASTALETPTLKQQHTNSRGMASWYSHNHPFTCT